MKTILLFLIGAFSISATSQTLLFNSGFEPGSVMGPQGSLSSDINGIDNSVPAPNDWDALDPGGTLGTFSIQYEGGDDTMRLAELVPDPQDPSNTVLEFWADYPNVASPVKTRVQSNLYDNIDLYDVFYSVKFYFPNDFDTFTVIPDAKITWFTIAEFWNEPGWEEPEYGFRIVLSAVKDTLESFWKFQAKGQTYNESLGQYQSDWEYKYDAYQIPFDTWMTFDIHFIEGDDSDGKFYMAVQPEGGSKETVFNINEHTRNLSDPSPDGVTKFNPMKMYCSAQLVDTMRYMGRQTHVYWDDFEVWEDYGTSGLGSDEFIAASVYPNPSNGDINIQTNTSLAKGSIEIINMAGEVVAEINHQGGKVFNFDLQLNKGIYSYHLSDVSGKSIRGRLSLR